MSNGAGLPAPSKSCLGEEQPTPANGKGLGVSEGRSFGTSVPSLREVKINSGRSWGWAR
jgi:hypothetical protein